MLNMEQIARTDPKEFNVGGTWEHAEWADFVQDQAKRARCKPKIDFKAGRDLYARSDQYSFFEKGVPALFFFEGNIDANEVYHKPGDVVETIDCAKMTEVARAFAACAYAIAVEGARLR
jgi:Zn-dependent M28 family amino/carboxypeptidase